MRNQSKDQTKKTRSCLDFSTQLLIFALTFRNAEAFFTFKVGNFQMYTLLIADFLYPEKTRGERISGQHTKCFRILLFSHLAVFLSKHCADRFLLGWLFLHRRLRSRQRGSFCNERLLLLPGGSLPKSVVRFYPNNPKKFFNLFLSKAFRLRFKA